ncbi:MAG: hypothetical protein ACXVDN_22830, partial [Ktedonobacteraceae bacterium]
VQGAGGVKVAVVGQSKMGTGHNKMAEHMLDRCTEVATIVTHERTTDTWLINCIPLGRGSMGTYAGPVC